MQDHNRTAWMLGLLALVVLAALALKAIASRGKTLVEGLVGIAAGICGALLFGSLAALGDGAPDWAAHVLSTKESWIGACAAFGAMFGDRLAVGAMVEADRFKADPQAWAARWLPWLRRPGGGQ